MRLVGWLSAKPMEGDEIQIEMMNPTSGVVKSRYIVTKVELCGDPRDMFFATVKHFGYVGLPLINKKIKEAK